MELEIETIVMRHFVCPFVCALCVLWPDVERRMRIMRSIK